MKILQQTVLENGRGTLEKQGAMVLVEETPMGPKGIPNEGRPEKSK